MKQDIKWWQIIALVILIAGVVLTIWSAQQQDLFMRNDLLVKTNIAKAGISAGQLKSLNGSEADLASPEYQALKTQLMKIRAADPSIRFAYLMGQRTDGAIFFYGDSESVDSVDYSPPGQEYPEVSALFLKAFSEKAELTEGPSSDRWGSFVSAIVPVTDQETGRLVAIFGLDVKANDWNYAIAKECTDIITASLLILVLVVAFGLIQRRNQREQQRLATSEDKFSRAFHTNPALMAVSSIEEGRFLDVNSSFLKTLGYFREEVLGRTPSDLGLYSDPAQWDFIQSQLKETGEVRDVYIKVIRKNHNMLDGSFSAIKIDVAGNPCLLTVILDITERKRTEEALFMSLVMDGVPICLSYIDADLRFVYMNKAYAEWFGRTREDLTGKCIRDVMGKDVFQQDLPHYQMVLSGKPISFENINHDTEGKEHFVIITLVPHFGGEQVTGFFTSIIDITDRKRAEIALLKNTEELHAANEQLTAAKEVLKAQFDALAGSERIIRESEERFRTIINSMQFGIVIIDLQTHTILEANPKALEMIGGTSESVFGSVCHRFICPAELGKCPVTDLLQTVDSSERVLLNLRGEKIPILKSVIKTMLGKKEVLIESFINITDRKLAEDTLLRVNQKLNVLSQLTRQDLTTQIFVLNSYLEIAKKQAAGQDGIIKNIESGERAVRFIKEISEFTKDYHNMGEKPPKYQNVKLAFLFGLSHISIGEIRHSLETENLEIFSDPLLEKAFQGLLENSVAHGGHVSHIRVSHTVTPDLVTIVFEDNGVGISAEKKERIFLRGEGARASVRGLFFVREILDITGITIRETGEPGKGARFEITVPKGAWRLYQNKSKIT